MAIITCPECKKEISDQAVTCPHCGFPLNASLITNPKDNSVVRTLPLMANNKSTDTSTLTKRTPLLIILAIFIVTVIGIIIVMTAGGKITANNVGQFELYNHELDVGLRLGASKTSVDRALGTPEARDEFFYPDVYLYAEYTSGKLASIYVEVPNDRWVTKGGITIGTTTKELKAVFGEPVSVEHDDRWWYYTSNTLVTGFKIIGDQVFAIYIYDHSKV